MTRRRPSGGAPSALSAATRELFFKLLQAGNTIGCAALVCEVDRSTIYRWLARGRADRRAGRVTKYVRLLADTRRALALAEAAHVANIARAAQAGQWTASAWWLERRRYATYGRKDRVELASDRSRPLVFTMKLPPRLTDTTA